MGAKHPVGEPARVSDRHKYAIFMNITDDAIVVVDCTEVCAVQTEVVLRQSLAEGVEPGMSVDKMDCGSGVHGHGCLRDFRS